MQCLARVLWRGLFSEHGEPCGGTTVARLVCYFGGGGTQNELRVPASPPIVLAREGHVWTAPGWQELSSRVQQWSEQPCVRPVSAVHVTAGHNALRGSGPGHYHAFDNALARVGCPDRRIDRLCITCCSPSQPFTSRRRPTRSLSCVECDRFLVAPSTRHHRPGHASDLVGERDGSDLGWPPRQQCRKPWSMFCAVELRIADHGERTRGEQAAQIAVALFADAAELVFA